MRSRIFWELWIVALADSKVEAVSTDLRFIAGFNAALCIATTALRASGLRTVTQAGHHVKTIESLELTIKANPKVIQRFKTFNNKRSSGKTGTRSARRRNCIHPRKHMGRYKERRNGEGQRRVRVMNGASWITNNIMISSESRE